MSNSRLVRDENRLETLEREIQAFETDTEIAEYKMDIVKVARPQLLDLARRRPRWSSDRVRGLLVRLAVLECEAAR